MSGRGAAAALAGTLLWAMACRSPAPPLNGASGAEGWRRVPIGLCEDYPEETRSLDEVRRDLDLVTGAGLDVLRVSIGWDDVEPEDDRFVFTFWDEVVRLAEAHHVRLIPYVAYTPAWSVQGQPRDAWRQPPTDPGQFEQVMERLARRYRGRIRSWELWNEPDNADYWRGTAAAYAGLLVRGAAGVRRGDPAAQVVFGGLAGKVEFLADVLARPGVAAAVDVVNVHAYFETWNGQPIERLTTYLEEVAAVVSRTGPRPIWLAEVGYGDYRQGAAVSPGYRAQFSYEHTLAFGPVALIRTMTLALASPHVALAAWYELKDPVPAAEVIGDANNRHLGVAFADRRPKPALGALAFLGRAFGRGYRSLDPLPRRRADHHPLEAHGFLLGNGDALVVAWIPIQPAPPGPSPGDGTQIDARHDTIELRLPCRSEAGAERLDVAGAPLGKVPSAPARGQLWLGPLDVRAGQVSLTRVVACQPR
jgi:hypothetical protein